jgi:hypothetical protein
VCHHSTGPRTRPCEEAEPLNDIMPSDGIESTASQIPGLDRAKWAVRGVKDRDELSWVREASVDVTYTTGGVEDTFAPELIRTDQVTIGEAGAAVHVGETVIHFADAAFIAPGEARKLAAIGGVGRLGRWPAMSAECPPHADAVGSTGPALEDESLWVANDRERHHRREPFTNP